MKKTYIIKKMKESEIASGINWDNVEKACIDIYPWDINGYKPLSEAKVIHTERGFYVYLISYENKIRATYRKINDMVCKDSCLEIFFKPNPEFDARYMNFEFNPLGMFYLGIGNGRYDSRTVTHEFWSIQFFIPFSFIESYYGKLNIEQGMKMDGNLYKCGDDTTYPHYGCWNGVTAERPDFHRPECFGSIILENE